MNEVTKLYENAELNRDCNLYKHFTECPMKHTQCEDCENFVYPPFTAEKQLQLVRWLIQKNITDYRIINYFEDSYYCLYAWEDGFKESDLFKSYEEALACLFNYLLQSLTEEERTQIRNILESEVRE